MSNDIQNEKVLGEQEQTCLEMKYEGYSMKEIAEKVGISYITVRSWFSTGGKLYADYQAYATEETKKRRSQANDTFKAHLNNAVRTLVHVMSKSKLDVARVQAAKEIINRQLGEPLKIVATDDGRVNEILEAIRKDDEEIQGTNNTGKSESTQTS